MNPPSSTFNFVIIIILLLQQTTMAFSKCNINNNPNYNANQEAQGNKNYSSSSSSSLKYKLIAMAATLVSSLIGISLPIIAKKKSYLKAENNLYSLVKSFAAGVILATGFIHVLPDAFENLTSPCIGEKPWKNFPFSGFVAMVAAIGTLIMEALITGYHKRSELVKSQPLDEEDHVMDNSNHHHGGLVHGPIVAMEGSHSGDLLMHTIVAQILEVGIVAHSIIVGISVGVCQSPNTIKPLVVAISFHQCFEGMGLGASISQAQFKHGTVAIMVIFFCLTIPTGIGIGFGISNIYNEESPKALIVEGLLLSASAGILIYMALVDLLAPEFMNPKMLKSFRFQLGASFALFVGLVCMSLLVLGEEK